MANPPSWHRGQYGSTFRVAPPTWSQAGQSPSYNSHAQQAPSLYASQWASQTPSQEQYRYSGAQSSDYTYGSSSGHYAGPKDTLTSSYRQSTGLSTQVESSSSANHWQFRSSSRNGSTPAYNGSTNSIILSQPNQGIDNSQSSAPKRSYQEPQLSSSPYLDYSTPGEARYDSNSNRPASYASVDQPEPEAYQPVDATDENGRGPGASIVDASPQTTTGSRKRKVPAEVRSSRGVSWSTLALPSKPTTTAANASSNTTQKDATPTVNLSAQTRTGEASGAAQQQAASPLFSAAAAGHSQTLSNQGPGPRASWSHGPDYGRKRVNGRWVARILPSESTEREGTQANTADRNDELLTDMQIEALQNANGSQPPQQQQSTSLPESESQQPSAESRASEGGARFDVVSPRPASPNQVLNPPGTSVPDLSVHGFQYYARRYNSLPPIIGSYLYFSNKRIKYNPVPSDVDDVRDKLFDLKKPVLLNSQQIADYWWHMSNVWQRSTKHNKDMPNGTVVETWECRHRRRVTQQSRTSETQGTRNRPSKRRMLEDSPACLARIRVVFYTIHADTDEDHNGGLSICKCVPEWMYLARSERASDHNHDLFMLDKFRRSDGIMTFVKGKAEEGYSFSAVAHWLHDKFGDVTKQAQVVNKQDVANSAQRWRRANRDVELRTTIEDPTPEEEARKRCVDLIDTATREGVARALVAVFQRMPAAVDIAMPVLEAMQDKHRPEESTTSPIIEGDSLPVPYPGLPEKIRKPSPPPPARLPPPMPARSESATELPVQNGVALRWQDPKVGEPSPLGPPQPRYPQLVPLSGYQRVPARNPAMGATQGPSAFPPTLQAMPYQAPVDPHPFSAENAASEVRVYNGSGHLTGVVPGHPMQSQRAPVGPPVYQAPPAPMQSGVRSIEATMNNPGPPPPPDSWRPSWLRPLEVHRSSDSAAEDSTTAGAKDAVDVKLDAELMNDR